MILVTGATGNAGGAVVRALSAAGEEVRALVRDAGGSRLPPGVDVVIGDLNKPETLEPHLRGVSAAFLLSGYDGLAETLANMRRAGVERVVLLSSSAAPGGDLSNAVARYAFGDVAVAMIDPADLAAVAVNALRTDELEGRSLRLSGPEAIYPADRVRILSAALDRELRFAPLSNEQARKEMSASMPALYVDAFFSFFVDGTIDETTVLPTVRELLGREPRPFAQWVSANLDSFR